LSKEAEKEYFDHAFEQQVRQSVSKFYAVGQINNKCYEDYLFQHTNDKKVLEYGCGTGTYAYELAKRGAWVTGIDISDVAITKAQERAGQEGLAIEFRNMDAENMDFPDDSFDVICGKGILHHLDLSRASDGRAVFTEPLGHNPVINLYRKMTPKLRTEDERPLRSQDLKFAGEFFNRSSCAYFHLTTLMAVPLRNLGLFKPVLQLLNGVDQILFKVVPVSRKYAWQVILMLESPNK
jgi:SAM-dependent methyltransferase